MNALHGFSLDIDMTPQLVHPQVGMFIDPSVDLNDVHIQCLYDAIQYANKLMYEGDS